MKNVENAKTTKGAFTASLVTFVRFVDQKSRLGGQEISS
jgi:hypothetical protein